MKLSFASGYEKIKKKEKEKENKQRGWGDSGVLMQMRMMREDNNQVTPVSNVFSLIFKKSVL